MEGITTTVSTMDLPTARRALLTGWRDLFDTYQTLTQLDLEELSDEEVKLRLDQAAHVEHRIQEVEDHVKALSGGRVT